MDNDKLATERVLKARTELILAHRFYGVLVSNVDPVPSRKIPTMATNGKQHFFNPDFIETLDQNELLTVQRHESEHDARHHHTRRGNRDPKEWNIATDYAINIDLQDAGMKMPKDALVDARFRGMSAEDIYRTRELDRERERKEQERREHEVAEQEESDEDSENGQPDADGDDGQPDDASDETNEKAADQPDDEDEGEGDGQDDGDEDGTEDEGETDADGEDADADGEQGNGKPAGAADEAGSEDDQGDATNGNGEPQEGEGTGNGEPTSCGDPGGMGEVLDAIDDDGTPADMNGEDQKWERIVRQAVSMAKAVGQLPGHVTQDIEARNSPTQDWRETLRAWFDQGALTTETWNRPNKRFSWSGMILPGSRRDGINKVVFLIDTSASCDDVALGCVRTEAQAALDDGAIDEIVVVYGDTRVTRVDTYHHTDEMEFDPRGRGGTDLRPLFQYVRDEHSDASLIVAFTDLEIGDAGPEPLCPVLWAVHGYPDRVREYIKNAPWNAPGIDVGAH